MERQHNSERVSPEVEVSLGELALALNYYNTDVFTYDEPFSHINHVYVVDDTMPEGAYIFNGELIDTLISYSYPLHNQAWPDKNDEEAYIASEMQSMNEL